MNLSRLGWAGEASYRGGGRHNRSRTSSATSSEADDSDEYNSSRLALDQSSADFFVTGDDDAKDFDYQLAETTGDVVGGGSNKRKASKATEEDEEVVADGVPPDQRDEASALPAARLMAFTPDSRALVTIESSTHQVTCRSLATGEEVWRFTPGTCKSSFVVLNIPRLFRLPRFLSTSVDRSCIMSIANFKKQRPHTKLIINCVSRVMPAQSMWTTISTSVCGREHKEPLGV